jgi:hypothetical protein
MAWLGVEPWIEAFRSGFQVSGPAAGNRAHPSPAVTRASWRCRGTPLGRDFFPKPVVVVSGVLFRFSEMKAGIRAPATPREAHVKKILVLLLVLGCPAAVRADAVLQWNQTATRAAFAAGLDNSLGCVDPLHESRMLAMMHVAIHDALNAIDRRFAPYAYDRRATGPTSRRAAVAAAARRVLVSVLPQLPTDPILALTPAAAVDLVEAAYAGELAAIPDGAAKARGIALGEAAAAAIIQLRTHDGAEEPFIDFGYVPGSNPGDFQFIPGYPPFAAGTKWGAVTPFVLASTSQFRPGPPYNLRSKKYAADFNEVKSLGAFNSTTRTAEQEEIAMFWAEGAPQGWNRIARSASRHRGFDLWENARLFGVLNLASADAYITDFANKYLYEFWRPITAIRAAASDGNPNTTADPAWDSLVPSPPAPDHPSGHSGQGGAMAYVLAQFFGDPFRFTTTSTTRPGARRSFSTFSEAAQENANSRIYIGYHFRHATIEGLQLGGHVGKVAFRHYLRPVRN